MPGPLSHKKGETGFTLVEVLAALGIFSIAAIGMVHASTENTRTANLIEQRALARIAAENQIADTLTRRGQLEAGVEIYDEELAGQSWVVRQIVTRTETEGILQVRVEVSRKIEDDISPPITEMTAFRTASR